MEDSSHIKIKNYELPFGDLGIQFKFNKDVTKSEIKTIMYYFENYISQLGSDYNISKVFYDNTKKDFDSIDDIQS